MPPGQLRCTTNRLSMPLHREIMRSISMRDLTRCVRHPAVSQRGYASLTVPTHRASTIVYDDAQSFAERWQRGFDGYTYGLHGTPTTRTLEAQLSELNGGARTVLLPSGQAAITFAMLPFLTPGDHVLIPDNVYGPVRQFCRAWLMPRGIAHTAYDPMIGAAIGDVMTERTKLVWIESPGSVTFEVQDASAIIRAAKAKGALVGCDNTWATPLLFKPLAHGADFAVEALSKYAGGHSDLLLGSITVADAGLHDQIKQVLHIVGISVSPDEVSLALRGIETMGVRLAHVGRISRMFAERLQLFAAIDRVLHPALPSCPGHTFWKRDFAGSSGVFSAVLSRGADARLGPALKALRLFAIGASWGGTRSLIAPMSVTADRTAVRWPDGDAILRISIGLEDPDDLWNDLDGLFRSIGG
jgi:cystathionine beta-lyase